MQRHFRKYGLNGYIVTCNFSDFFNSASHKVVYNENKKRIFDENIRNIANKCMEIYGEKNDKKAINCCQVKGKMSQIFSNISTKK